MLFKLSAVAVAVAVRYWGAGTVHTLDLRGCANLEHVTPASSKSLSYNIAPLCQNGAENHDLRCVWHPRTLRSRC